MIMVSVCLPSDALSQPLLFYLGFSYLGSGVSLHGCISKAQPLVLTLGESPPDFERGVAPLSPPDIRHIFIPRLYGSSIFNFLRTLIPLHIMPKLL